MWIVKWLEGKIDRVHLCHSQIELDELIAGLISRGHYFYDVSEISSDK